MSSTHHDLPTENVPQTPSHGLAFLQAQPEPLSSERTTPIPTSVRRVPPEVLGEIFLCAPISGTRPRNYQAIVTQASLVCRSWRNAALLTPWLWCDIWLRADSPSLPYEYISAWAARAGRIPKHLEVSAMHCGGINPFYGAEFCAEATSTCIFADSVFGQLLKQSPSEWTSVTIDCPTLECLQHFVASLDLTEHRGDHGWDYIQFLEVITTRWCAWPDADNPEPLFHFLPPSVDKLNLRLPHSHEVGFSDCWDAPLQIPPSSLHRLTFLDLSFGRFMEIYYLPLFATLRHCTMLETLRVDFSFAGLMHLDPLSSVHRESGFILPKLRHLDLRQMDWSFYYLKRIKLPLLQELQISLSANEDVGKLGTRGPEICTVDDPNPYNGYDGRELIDFIRGGGEINNQLRSLHIKAICLHNNTLFHILRDLPALRHLRLEWIQFLPIPLKVDDFAKLMAHTPRCVPDLKTLEILNLKHANYLEIGSLDSFVEERGIESTLTCHDHAAALREQEEGGGSYGSDE